MPCGDDGASPGHINCKEDKCRDAHCDTNRASSRCIMEKAGHPGLVMKVTNCYWDALFAQRAGVVTLCCGAQAQLCGALCFTRKYTYSSLQSPTE